MKIDECIKKRRSVRKYLPKEISMDIILKILDAGIWAPSAKNRQPWKFKIITNVLEKEKISQFSKYKSTIDAAPCVILIFLDREKTVDYLKDVQSCGAVIQNIILCAHSYGIGSCWIGEIINQSRNLFQVVDFDNNRFELMALVALGYASEDGINWGRRKLEDFIL